MEKKIIQSPEKTKLANGITVISEKIPTVRSVALGVWVLNGSRSETPEIKGMAHFIEHLVFKGTAKRTNFEIANALEKVGGSINAYTAKEVTVFYAHFIDEYLETAVDVLSDITSNALFRREDIEKEKEVVIEEINSSYDAPDEVCHENFQEALYPDNSLGWPILGTGKNVSGFTREDIVKFWRGNYSAGNLVIAAAGNLRHSALVDLVNKYFSPPQSPEKAAGFSIDKESAKGKKIYTKTVQAHLCLGRRTFAYADPRRYSLGALSTYLGGGMSSLLFQKIREEHGLAYSVYTFTDFYRDTGSFGIYIATDPSRKEQVYQLVSEVLKKVRNEGMEESSLTDIRNQMKGELLLGLESSQMRMSLLAKLEIYLELRQSIEDIIRKIDSISTGEIKELAEAMLNPDELVRVEVLPN
jgi:predicted Zn-dependent peptidase